ncbi:MAG: hypothetical protein C0608_07280 [Deltaproteobacteria bacterium]|nr:MAG: hypothetical protein C0608_07280 [Deltaproteobacteria bacterium]
MKRLIPCFLFILTALALAGCDSSKAPEGDPTALSTVSGIAYRPAEAATIYVYRVGDDFRGPPMTRIGPLAFDGSFSVDLPPGEYNFLLRQRAEGDDSGPVKEGDLKTDPIKVVVAAGRPISLDLKGFIKEGNAKESFGEEVKYKARLEGRITDAEGGPVEGVRVHAYDHVQMSERPKFVSARTGPDGRYELNLPEGGTYYLCARDQYGGPPKVGDLYGRYYMGTVEPSAVIVEDGNTLEGVDITVHTVW